MRGDIENQLEAAKDQNRPVHLLRIDLGCSNTLYKDKESCELNSGAWTPPIFITDWDRSITWNNDEYLALGHFIGMSDINETSMLQVSSLSLTLSGVDQQYISLLLRKEYIDRPIVIYRGFVSDSGVLKTSPFEIFKGRMDKPFISDSPTKTQVTISAKNHLADFERKSGRHTNNAEMQRYYPSDTSFAHASEGLKEIRWGRE